MPATSPTAEPTTEHELEIEGMAVRVYPDAPSASRAAALAIARTVREATAARGRAVLGLATGKTPIPVYDELAALHRRGELSFRDVSTYNLDEYYPIAPTDPNSYRTFMGRHLFSRVDLAPNRAHLLDGSVPEAFADDHGAAFDRWIAAEGGLDLQLLGIGRNGHVGFNEPTDLPLADALALPTRLAPLAETTLDDAAADFAGDRSAVPPGALTVGLAPILAARSILVLAFGPRKAAIVSRALRGPITPQVPATLLRHARGRVTWLVDRSAFAAP